MAKETLKAKMALKFANRCHIPNANSIFQIGMAKIGSAEVGFNEVGLHEGSFAEVGLNISMLFPPLVPRIHPLFEDIEVFLIGHSASSSFRRVLTEFRLTAITLNPILQG